MRCRDVRIWLPCLILMSGCAPHEAQTSLVSPSAFGDPPSPIRTAAYTQPASTAVAQRVDEVGRKLVAANKQFGVEPLFSTVGTPGLELFHQGRQQIIITQGLVDRCKTDGELSALLATELAKMVVEREAQAGPAVRRPDPLPPMDTRVGSSVGGGSFGPADQTGLAEMVKFQPPRRAENAPAPPLPDPQQLARTILHNAQVPETELAQVAPLLNAAAADGRLERQMTRPPTGQAWTKQ